MAIQIPIYGIGFSIYSIGIACPGHPAILGVDLLFPGCPAIFGVDLPARGDPPLTEMPIIQSSPVPDDRPV